MRTSEGENPCDTSFDWVGQSSVWKLVPHPRTICRVGSSRSSWARWEGSKLSSAATCAEFGNGNFMNPFIKWYGPHNNKNSCSSCIMKLKPSDQVFLSWPYLNTQELHINMMKYLYLVCSLSPSPHHRVMEIIVRGREELFTTSLVFLTSSSIDCKVVTDTNNDLLSPSHLLYR